MYRGGKGSLVSLPGHQLYLLRWQRYGRSRACRGCCTFRYKTSKSLLRSRQRASPLLFLSLRPYTLASRPDPIRIVLFHLREYTPPQRPDCVRISSGRFSRHNCHQYRFFLPFSIIEVTANRLFPSPIRSPLNKLFRSVPQRNGSAEYPDLHRQSSCTSKAAGNFVAQRQVTVIIVAAPKPQCIDTFLYL